MDSIYVQAAIWVALVVIASFVSKKLGITLALIEILMGVIAGNTIGLEIYEWVGYLSSMGAMMLTLLAGADIDPQTFKKNWKSSVSIGVASFTVPAIIAFLVAFFILGWNLDASKVAGIALSTTSVAVVYTVMLDTGLNETPLGQSMLAACFVTDLGSVALLGIVFTGFSWKMLILLGAAVLTCFVAKPICTWTSKFFEGSTSEGDLKLITLMLLILGAIAVFAGSEAVLPAYVLGLALASYFQDNRDKLERLRAIGFVTFIPFYFIKAGSLLSIPSIASWASLGIIGLLFLVKVAAKFLGIMPVMKLFKFKARDGIFNSLLFSTGLTFGTICSLYGLTNGFITTGQYGILVTVVISTAIIPTIIANKCFMPSKDEAENMIEE